MQKVLHAWYVKSVQDSMINYLINMISRVTKVATFIVIQGLKKIKTNYYSLLNAVW